MEAIDSPLPRVFVTNYAGHNFTGADKFGELKALTHGYVSFESLDRLKYEMLNNIYKKTHRDDYLLISGIAPLAVIISVLWLENHGKIKLLIEDKKHRNNPEKHYRELIIDKANFEQMYSMIEDSNELPA